MKISIDTLKRFSLFLEYGSFFICFLYWFFYSLVRVKGIPLLFAGIEIGSTLSGVFAVTILFFNALFFSRLLVELILNIESLRSKVLASLSRYILPLSIALMLVVFATGGRFDYASYKLQWNIIMTGANPWGFVEGGMVNAYGYVFNFLAPLYAIHSLLPKILFVLLLLYFGWQLASRLSPNERVLSYLLCINPFTISTLAVYGFVDGMCSILLGIALLDISQKSLRSSFQSGVLLSLSFLTKFYTVVALPIFLASSYGLKSMASFVKGFLVTSSFIIFLSFILWGDSIVEPLLFAQARDPSFLTLWKYLPYPELRSIVFSTISIFAILLASSRNNIPCSLKTAAVLSIIFGSYYLGHQQFYLGILVSLAVYIVEATPDKSLRFNPFLLRSFAVVIGWLIFIQTGFELFDEFKPSGFQHIIPLLSFLNSTILFACGIYWLTTNRPIRAAKNASIV